MLKRFLKNRFLPTCCSTRLLGAFPFLKPGSVTLFARCSRASAIYLSVSALFHFHVERKLAIIHFLASCFHINVSP